MCVHHDRRNQEGIKNTVFHITFTYFSLFFETVSFSFYNLLNILAIPRKGPGNEICCWTQFEVGYINTERPSANEHPTFLHVTNWYAIYTDFSGKTLRISCEALRLRKESV